MIEKAVELEIAYAEDCLPKGILGLNANLFREYVQHIADRRLERHRSATQVRVAQSVPLDE